MLRTFCAASNFKSLLLQHDDMPVIQKYRTIVDQAAKDRSRDTLAGLMTSPVDAEPLILPKRSQQRVVVSERAVHALDLMYQALFNHPLPPTRTCHLKHVIGKVSFTPHTESKCDCNIFFRSIAGDIIAPGVIQYIISVPSPLKTGKMDLFFVVERYASLPENGPLNAFSSHAAFGASLWSSKMSPTLEAIPVDHIICHAIFRPWVKGAILFKALDQVSRSPIVNTPRRSDTKSF